MAELAEFATLDLERQRRRGYPEAVFCAGKTAEQVGAIAAAVTSDQVPLFTRAGPEHAAAILAARPDARHDPAARLVAWPPHPPAPTGGLVAVLTAGTS